MDDVKVGEFDGVILRIIGVVYIIGFNYFVFDEEDLLKDGFILK